MTLGAVSDNLIDSWCTPLLLCLCHLSACGGPLLAVIPGCFGYFWCGRCNTLGAGWKRCHAVLHECLNTSKSLSSCSEGQSCCQRMRHPACVVSANSLCPFAVCSAACSPARSCMHCRVWQLFSGHRPEYHILQDTLAADTCPCTPVCRR